MIHDIPKFLTIDTLTTSSRVAGYADDTTVYIKCKNVEHLLEGLQSLSNKMVTYCNQNGLKLNGQKTQIITTARKTRQNMLFTPTMPGKAISFNHCKF